jgi:hypothetical protein
MRRLRRQETWPGVRGSVEAVKVKRPQKATAQEFHTGSNCKDSLRSTELAVIIGNEGMGVFVAH